MNQASYATYGAWKRWADERFGICTEADARYFAGELRGIVLPAATVIEVGFGNGSFLAWAKEQGASVYGTEILPEAVERAQSAGFETLPTDLSECLPSFRGRVDAIVAFDVLEHMDLAAIERLLDVAAELLRPGGVMLARFPNGQSPFGVFYQNGDHTHRMSLSASIIEQVLTGRPLALENAGGPCRVTSKGARGLVDRVRNSVQDGVEFFLRKIYGVSNSMSPNLVIRLRRFETSN